MRCDRPPGRVGVSPRSAAGAAQPMQLEVEGAEFARLALELLRGGTSIRFRARGGSMSPFIRDGDVLTVTPCNADSLRLGDVALYRNAIGSVWAHRVLGRSGKGRSLVLEMRGDSSRGAQESVPADAILGRVVSARRGDSGKTVGGAADRWLAVCLIHLVPLPLLRLGGALRRVLTNRQ